MAHVLGFSYEAIMDMSVDEFKMWLEKAEEIIGEKNDG